MIPAQDSSELFDIVDEHDSVIGQRPRAEVHACRLRHRAVHVLLLNQRDELYIQKRSSAKDSYPGRYDSSASGHLAAGESYDSAAARELDEELGLTVSPARLQPLCKIEACEETGWEFAWVYLLRGEYHPQINRTEIESGAYWPLAQIASLLAARPELFAPAFIRVFNAFQGRETVAIG